MNALIRHLCLVLLLTVLAVVPARANVSGFVQWNWADYQRDYDDDSNKDLVDVDASSFLQTYSLLYESNHLINGGRAGEWNISLGYQWSSLSNSLNGEDETFKAGKVLYKGDLLFAPGGLPLRVYMYSRDMNVAAPVLGSGAQLVDTTVYRDLNGSGEHYETGITMWAGIKNGSYLGQYREMLSQLPKLLMDYRETYVRDLDGLDQSHWRMRDLAFVSLNKKDNWFHYRASEYTDMLNPGSDYERRTYLLGTVDHTMKRQWINLTNWIQLSVDGSLEQSASASDRDEDTYQLNLFTKFRRKEWQAQNFSSFERSLDEAGKQEKNFIFPLFASGQLDPRNKWRMSLIQSSEEKMYASQPTINEYLLFTNYQLETVRQSGKIQTSTLAFDVKRGSLQDNGQAAQFDLEFRTDNRRDLLTDWRAGYGAGWFNSTETGDNYVEQKMEFSLTHRPSKDLRIGGNQLLVMGSGNYDAYSTEYLRPALSGSTRSSNFADYDVSGNPWRSKTDLYLEFTANSRWNHRLFSLYDYISRDPESESLFELGYKLRYNDREKVAQFEALYQSGDDLALPTYASEIGSLPSFVGTPEKSFSGSGSLSYAPVRSWSTKGKAGFLWAEGDRGSAGVFALEQRVQYNLFASSGLRRKLMVFEEELYYERFLRVDNETYQGDAPWYVRLRLASTFFLHRYLTLGARAEYRYYGESDANVMDYSLSAQIPFEKLSVQVQYAYGQSDAYSPEGPAVTEHRWEVDIKKTF